MRNNILTLLVGFLVMLGSVLLVKLGLDRLTSMEAAPGQALATVNLDMNRRAILYRVQGGETLWGLAERFYGAGRRWEDIARANNMAPGQGLQAGTVIRIPLGAGDPLTDPAAQLTTSGEPDAEPPLPPAPEPFGMDEHRIGAALCYLDRARFPNGALCVARMTEAGTVRINVFDVSPQGDTSPAAIYEAPEGNALRDLRPLDTEGKGTDMLYTIWFTPGDASTSRVFRWAGESLELVSETPGDPMALRRLKEREDS
jgi:hypothetical protein